MTTSFKLDKIKVNIEYQGRTITQALAPYKTIKFLKELSRNLFYPIPQDVQILYFNKDITNCDNYLLGDYFREKKQILIKAIPKSGMSKNGTNAKRTQLSLENRRLYLCLCKNDIIYYYCRACKVYICNSCRINSLHLKHMGVQIDIDNLEESAKLYAMTIQSDILYNIKSTREYYSKFQEGKAVDPASRHEIVQRKYDQLRSIYISFEDTLEFKNYNMDNVENMIKQYNINTQQTNEDIELILNTIYTKWTKPKKRMTFSEMKEIYEVLSEKEMELDDISSNILSYRINKGLNLKMDKIYDKIEAVLDDVLNSSIPLGLESSTYYMFELIRKKKNKPPIKFNNEHENDEETEEKNKEHSISNNSYFKDRIFIDAKKKEGEADEENNKG